MESAGEVVGRVVKSPKDIEPQLHEKAKKEAFKTSLPPENSFIGEHLPHYLTFTSGSTNRHSLTPNTVHKKSLKSQ